MPRLKNLRPRLAEANVSRYARAAMPSEQESNVRRMSSRPWERKRQATLARDKFLCQECLRKGRLTVATEVDHIIPLEEGGTDEGSNLQSLCHDCHALKTTIENTGRASLRPEWLPMPACSVIVVTGPPCGGKTTYCDQHARTDDKVIDLDVCFQDVCGIHGHEASRAHLDTALRWRNKQLAELAGQKAGKAYFIICCPTRKELSWWLRKLGAVHVLCNPGKEACLQRARALGRPAAIVEEWFSTSDM